MKSHTGGVMSFGIGGFVCKSSKQKLNTKSSTEAEVVGASDYLPNTIWMQNFLREQGYELNESVYHQDNESAMKLEKNGRSSAGQKSRHIDIRFFWIKDRTEANGIKIDHCPTLKMLADFFTKPLQGHLFRRFRDVILGHCPIASLHDSPVTPSEERVGKGRTGANCTVPTVPKEPQKRTEEQTTDTLTNQNREPTRITTLTTWADVVKRGCGANVPGENQNKRFVSRSLLSRNNPVK